ncbi:hypothetical protein G7Y89_g1561 [Cudoniella acicularis]|uniref:ER membrane protein complex subunit 3 n=1 Tax=Cudoniella acicularis TaxID=354080 RepID=A0A8H4RW43_9HELO|nr:hypothetical protein G7Y89_g1561 [Cudoniella acicularis]
MAQVPVQTIHRDPQLFYWILIPITVVMILTGILRHYATVLMATTPKKQDLPAIREQRSLLRGINLRTNANAISAPAFQARKDYLVTAYEKWSFLERAKYEGTSGTEPDDGSRGDGRNDGHDEGEHGYDCATNIDYGVD